MLFRYWLALAVTLSLLSLPSLADEQHSHSVPDLLFRHCATAV